jgi:arylsulfatase A-like enzyme
MFTGEYTARHGVRGYMFQDDAGMMRMRDTPLPGAKKTLAEHLKGAGYTTGFFAANEGYLSPRFNLDQGFDTYHAKFEPGRAVIERAVTWLDEAAQGPFFLFCNLMDAHRPYNLTPCSTLPGDVSQERALLDELREKTLQNNAPLDQSLAAAVSAQYELGVANADRALGELMDALQQRGLYEDLLFIATSDHGEYLGEHMLVEHSKDVYEEAIHVPLLVKLPDQREGILETTTRSLVQIPSTILAQVELARPQSLPPALGEPTSDFPLLTENYYSRDWDIRDPRWNTRFQRVRTALYDANWKFVLSSDGAHELYDLAKDPLESTNLATLETHRAASLLSRCTSVVSKYGGKLTTTPDIKTTTPASEDEEALRSLGYL